MPTPAPTRSTPIQQVPAVPLAARFEFDGGPATYSGTAIAGLLVTVPTPGICTPWAICMAYRWRTKHTLVDGYPMRFTENAAGLFGHWITLFLLSIVTVGTYGFWVAPRLVRWITEHQEFDTRTPRALR